MHPFAIPGNTSGAFGMKAGDRVRYTIDGRTGVADEFLHDGDAFVSWDDGEFGTVKWNHLEPATKSESGETMTKSRTGYRGKTSGRSIADPGMAFHGNRHQRDLWSELLPSEKRRLIEQGLFTEDGKITKKGLSMLRDNSATR